MYGGGSLVELYRECFFAAAINQQESRPRSINQSINQSVPVPVLLVFKDGLGFGDARGKTTVNIRRLGERYRKAV